MDENRDIQIVQDEACQGHMTSGTQVTGEISFVVDNSESLNEGKMAEKAYGSDGKGIVSSNVSSAGANGNTDVEQGNKDGKEVTASIREEHLVGGHVLLLSLHQNTNMFR